MISYIKTKSVLSRLRDAPDPYFGITWNMNLYRGCQHGCIYCDSRSNVYKVGDLSHIRIKENAIDLLSAGLSRKRIKGTIGTGSMNDPYMPLAVKTGNTRKALKVIAQQKFPVHIITKSSSVCNDADIIKDISTIYAAVSVTITTSDDKLAKRIEPGATISSKRFEAINSLSKNGIYCGIVLTPVLPYITDNSDNIAGIIKRAADNGAQYVLGWMSMTQREGQREYYYSELDKKFPGLKLKYIKKYKDAYNCKPENADELYNIFKETCIKYNMTLKMKHYENKKSEQLTLF